MAQLAERAASEAVAAEAVGWRGDAIEAECFAFLAMRRLERFTDQLSFDHRCSDTDGGGTIGARATVDYRGFAAKFLGSLIEFRAISDSEIGFYQA